MERLFRRLARIFGKIVTNFPWIRDPSFSGYEGGGRLDSRSGGEIRTSRKEINGFLAR